MVSVRQLLGERLTDPANIERAEEIVGTDKIRSNVGVRTTHELKSAPHAEVEKYLIQHGIDTSTMSSGMVKDKHGRFVRVGKVLTQLKAPQTIINANAKQLQGSALAHNDYRVVTSNKPMDVAGMTSETDWHEDSCMNLEHGCNREYLHADVEHGSKVHFLVHKDDADIKHPLARALSKKYVGKLPNGRTHEIWRRDDKTYGTSNTAFEHTVDAQNELAYPMHPDVPVYELQASLYNNGNKNVVNKKVMLDKLSDLDVDQKWLHIAANDNDSQLALKAAQHPDAHSIALTNAAGHQDKNVALAAIRHPHASNVTIATAAQHHDPEVAFEALKHPLADDRTVEWAMYNPTKKVAMAALNHPAVTAEATRRGVGNSDLKVALASLSHHKADEDTVVRAMYPDTPPEVAMAALHHPKIHTRAVTIAALHRNPEVAMAAVNHPKADSGTIFQAFKHADPRVVSTASDALDRSLHK